MSPQIIAALVGAGVVLIINIVQQAFRWGSESQAARFTEQWRIKHEQDDARRHESNVLTMGRIEGKVDGMMMSQGEIKATLNDHEREINRLRDEQ